MNIISIFSGRKPNIEILKKYKLIKNIMGCR